MDLLTNEFFQNVLEEFADSSAPEEKMSWWLTQAHSAERWFQFELAHIMDRHLGDKYVTRCEVQRCDIVVFDAAGPGHPTGGSTALAKLELKVRGSWYVADTDYVFAQVREDINKVSKYDVPGMALLLWVLAYPSSGNARSHWWIQQATRDGTGLPATTDLRSKMAAYLMEMNCIARARPRPSGLFDSFEFQLWAC